MSRSPQAVEACRFSAGVEEALALLGPVMRPQNPSLLAPEYPLVFGEPRRGGFRILWVGDRPASGAAFLPFEVRTQPPVGLRVGAIGSVGTHPDFRGRGLVGAVLRECEEALRREGCAVALLWAQAPEVFRRNGYAEVGAETAFVLLPGDEERIPQVAGVVLPFDERKDLRDCLRLYEKHPCRVARTTEEFARLASIPGMRIFVHRRQGRCTAYAALGKGTDFPGTIHEWGGDLEGIAAIVRHCLVQGFCDPLHLLASGASDRLEAAFAGWGFEPVPGFLGMTKAIDRDALAAAVSPSLEERFGIEAGESPSGFVLRGERGALEMGDANFLRFLFGLKGVSGEAMEAARILGVPRLAETIPFGIYFWGLDSV